MGISHECDYPPSIRHLPRVTNTPIDASGASGEIDADVRRLMAAGRPVILVDAAGIAALRPDLLLSQELCEVCAVGPDQLEPLERHLPPATRVLRLSGTTIAGVEEDIRRVAAALDLDEEGDELIAGLRYRLARIAREPVSRRPRVVCIEWLDPLYLAAHWVPELVHAAGGEDVGGQPGGKSLRRVWAEVAAMQPDLIVIMLCGFDVARAEREWTTFARANPRTVALLGAAPIRFVDGNAYTSRPGPRLVDGAERIAAILKEVRGER